MMQEFEVSTVFGMLREQSSGRVLSGILGFRGQEKDTCGPEVTLRKTPKAAVKTPRPSSVTPTEASRETHIFLPPRLMPGPLPDGLLLDPRARESGTWSLQAS